MSGLPPLHGARCPARPTAAPRMSLAAQLVALPVRAYRLLLSPWIGHACRFQPTCSVYALDALARHGALRGTALMLRRLGRCHPWGGSGFDPVPPVKGDPR